MKKIIILLFIAITAGANADDSVCKIYADQMNKKFKTLSFKYTNRMDIPNYELNMFKDSIASVYGECDENTKYQKLMKSLIIPMQDSVCGISVGIVGGNASSIGRKMLDGIGVSQYEVDIFRTKIANAETHCRGNTKKQKEGKEKLKEMKTFINSRFK